MSEPPPTTTGATFVSKLSISRSSRFSFSLFLSFFITFSLTIVRFQESAARRGVCDAYKLRVRDLLQGEPEPNRPLPNTPVRHRTPANT